MKESMLLRRGLRLEYLTLGWNIVGTGVALMAALAAHSVALIGFGLDSLLEIFASLVVVWQLQGAHAERERPALRAIGAAFIVLALYVGVQSTRTLFAHTEPGISGLGIVWLSATFVVMLWLSRAKSRVGAQLNNAVLQTEARVTLIDALLAGAVLLGLVLNALVGWWWADPLAGLVIVFYGFREGFAAWRTEAAGGHQ